jgi:hypothetical protein
MCDPDTLKNRASAFTAEPEEFELVPEQCWNPATFQDQKFLIIGRRSTGKSYMAHVAMQAFQQASAHPPVALGGGQNDSANSDTKQR